MKPLHDGVVLSQIPLEVTVSIGKVRPLIKDLLKIGVDSILPLDKKIDDYVELYIGERLVAKGELQEVGQDAPGQLAVRVTEIVHLTGEA